MAVIGVVCAGAGARGAYEAGALSVLLPWLVERHPEDRIVMLGTSAGAINAALFSGALDRDRPPEQAVGDALELWRSAEPGQVFTRLRSTLPRTALRYGLELAGLGTHVDSLLDSSPLRRTMEDRVDWTRLDTNLSGGGRIDAAGVVTTECGPGRTRIFAQGTLPVLPPPDDVRGIDYRLTTLRPPHVQASAAIPVAFLPVEIADGDSSAWYVDGGVRLNAPVKPALDVGADRVVVVATTPDPDLPQSTPGTRGEPDVFGAAAVTMRAVLVDRMAEDVRSLRRVNTLVEAAGRGQLSVAGRAAPYRAVHHMYVGPPRGDAIALAARRVFLRYYRGPAARLSDLGVLAALIGGVDGAHGELFSFLFFDGRFHAELIDMGRQDAARVVDGGWRT